MFGENQLDVKQINRNPSGNYPCGVIYNLSGCSIIYMLMLFGFPQL